MFLRCFADAWVGIHGRFLILYYKKNYLLLACYCKKNIVIVDTIKFSITEILHFSNKSKAGTAIKKITLDFLFVWSKSTEIDIKMVQNSQFRIFIIICSEIQNPLIIQKLTFFTKFFLLTFGL